MNTFSFQLPSETVHQLSLKALNARRFEVLSNDNKKGVILARLRKTWVKPETALRIQISPLSDQLTNIHVRSMVKSKWLTAAAKNRAEQRFFEALINCFQSDTNKRVSKVL